MLRLLLLLFAFLTLATIAVTLIATVVLLLVCACVVGVPAYLVYRHWTQGSPRSSASRNPMENLQTLYVEGKIDLWEFENRVANLVAVEH